MLDLLIPAYNASYLLQRADVFVFLLVAMNVNFRVFHGFRQLWYCEEVPNPRKY